MSKPSETACLLKSKNGQAISCPAIYALDGSTGVSVVGKHAWLVQPSSDSMVEVVAATGAYMQTVFG